VIVIPGGADIRDVEQRAHGLIAVAEVREPDGGVWHPMLVRSGSVTLTEIGTLPARTAQLSVMSWTDDTDDVGDWLTPFGSWIRLWHKVVRVGGTVIMVPLGYFRVDKLNPNPLDGTIDITASDVGALVVDYALPTLAAGQVTTAQTYLAALTTMLTDTLTGIPAWWTTAVDPGDASTTAKPSSRLQYTGSRVDAAVNLAARLGRVITTPLDGSAAFRLAAARDSTDEADITVRGGQLGNLVELSSEANRDGIANVALVLYTREVKAAGARTRIEQRRLVQAYTNTDADTAAYGPFGTVTIEVDSTNIADDTAARAAADTVLKATLNQVRDVGADISPIYGLESGDIIRAEDAQGIATTGILTGAGVGLTAADSWSLTLRTFVPVGTWSGPRSTVLTDAYEVRDDADWTNVASKSVDLTGHTTKGWSANGGTVKDGGSRLLFTANGSATARLHSPSAFTMPAARRLRVTFTVRNGATSTDMRARAYIDPNASGPVYGAFVIIKPGKSRTVKADLDVGAGTTYTIGVDMDKANGSPLANTHKIYVSNVRVEKAVRRPQ
jgi:hypothetical protein